MIRNKKVATAVGVSVAAFIAGILLYIIFINPSRKAEDEVNRQVVTEEKNEPLIGESKELPSDFPEDFPIYPGAIIESAYTARGDEAEAVSVVWLVRDSQENVSAFYKREIKRTDWIINSTFEEENSATLSFEKGPEQGFIGIAKRDDGFIIISVTIGASFPEPRI